MTTEIKLVLDLSSPDALKAFVKLVEASNGVKATTNQNASLTNTTEPDEAEEEASAPAPKKRASRAKKVEAPQEDVAETEDEEVEEVAEVKPAPIKDLPATPSVGVVELRELVSAKVTEHRVAIKDKLTELGAGNVSTLSPDSFEEFANFLRAL